MFLSKKVCIENVYAGVIVVSCAVRAAAAGIELVGVPQSKPFTQFHQIFTGCLPQDDLELIRFWGGIW